MATTWMVPGLPDTSSMTADATAMAIANSTWVSSNRRRRPTLATSARRSWKNVAGCTSAGWWGQPAVSMVR